MNTLVVGATKYRPVRARTGEYGRQRPRRYGSRTPSSRPALSGVGREHMLWIVACVPVAEDSSNAHITSSVWTAARSKCRVQCRVQSERYRPVRTGTSASLRPDKT